MTCFLVSIEWLLYLALSADSHRTNVIELSTIRSDLLVTSDLGSYFGLCDPDHISRSNCPYQPHAQYPS
jgi:hypothetical protein